ncbi:MAG: DUF2062 domain-containing protein [Candidatus Brocadiia bacterium]
MPKNNSDMQYEEIEIWIVIPVYNQAGSLRAVVGSALSVHSRVMVVDDGSDEPAEKELEGLDVICVRHEENRGKGAALLTGAEEAEKRGASHIVTLDADGQHLPEEFPKFQNAIRANPLSLIVGRRDMSGQNVPFGSRFGRAFGNFWARLQTGQDVGDVQSGYRAYPVFVLQELTTWCRGFAFEVEIITRAAWAGVQIENVDISVRYDDEIKANSHFRGVRDNMVLSLLNTHLTMRSILPWPHQKLCMETLGREKITLFHPLRSLKTLLTENATPGQLAFAGGLGVFLGTLPLIGFHTVTIIAAASYLRLNKPLSVASSQFCMPPFVPALCIELGYYIRHGHFLTKFSLRTLGYEAHERLFEWLIGSVVLAPVLALFAGVIVFVLAKMVRKRLAGNSPA